MGDGKKENKLINSTTIGMAQNPLIQRNGEAASQMIQAFKGVRYDSAGKNLYHKGRSLSNIHKYKINEKFKEQNIKQQSGFAAELIQEARDNKAAIKSGKGSSIRTRTTDGIGETNNQKYDHVKVDSNGNVIEGTGSQMKFLKVDDKGRYAVVDKIVTDPKWEKYDGKIDIPSDQYEGALKYANEKAETLRNQAEKLRNRGDFQKAKALEEKAEKYEDVKKRIRKSNTSSKEAIEARTNPRKFVSKEVLKDSHDAGVEAAKGAFILSGAVSCAQNLISVIKDEKDIEEAIVDVTVTTAKSGVVAYGIGASGTVVKSVMHSSESSILRRIGNTNAPAMIATGVVEIGKSIKRYATGDIDEVELLQELGEKGTGIVAGGFGSAIGGAVGTMILPGIGTVVGGFLGSMIAYSTSSMLYHGALNALKDAKISEERRRVIEELSIKCIEEMKAYERALEEYESAEYNRREKVFTTLFEDINKYIWNDNINGFIKTINEFGKEFGVKMQFNTFEEFDDFMNDDNTVFTL